MEITENKFQDLGLSDEMLRAIAAKGFETPTQIQSLVIPRLLSDDCGDLIAQSQTGTGKTATFGIPVMQQIDKEESGVKAIILVPTRELAVQAADELHTFNAERRLAITAIYGGASMSEQLRRLAKGVDIVVGTPGRLLDHIRRGTLKLNNAKYLILDEADEMLNMGFIEDVEEIMSHISEQRRVLLFSATMPRRIVDLSNRYMHNTEIIKIESRQLTTELTEQIYFEVRESDKFDALTRIIDIQNEFYGIIFCRTKVSVDEVVNRLLERGYSADGLHGDVSQGQREKILKKFREKSINILVATDVAARGIDVNNLTHVINYALPQDSESYVHRIGRTGRAGNQGTAITFITRSEMRQFGFIKRDIKVDIKREELPSAQDIVAMKRNKIKTDLQEIITTETYADHRDMAEELLEMYSPEVALSALLRLAFRSELDENNYPEIRSFSVDRKGTARLFLAVGKRDGYTGRKIVDMLKDRCGLRDKHIDSVSVLDNYSFVSVPFADAEMVVNELGAHRGRPMAEITKESAAQAEAGESGEPSFGRNSRRPSGRGDRRERGDRGDRRERSDRGDRGGDRRERSDRGDRGERRSFDRSDRGERSYSDRGERGGNRAERRSSDRGDRYERNDRSDRKQPTRVMRKSEMGGGNGKFSRPSRSNSFPSEDPQTGRINNSGRPSTLSGEDFDWSIFEGSGNWGGDKKGKKRK